MSELWYKIRYGIENVIYWLPVIWRDRHWDNDYIYLILHHKLAAVREQMSYRCPREARNVGIAVWLLKRMIADEYDSNACKAHSRKWGKLQVSFEQMPDSPGQRWVATFPNAETEAEQQQAHEEYGCCLSHAEDMRDQDINYLFGLLADRIRDWWD